MPYRGRSLPSRERGLKFSALRRPAGDRLSLPSRERGLKYHYPNEQGGVTWSLPSRERGLKFEKGMTVWNNPESLPSRERGLKSAAHPVRVTPQVVAPFTGAWIEIPARIPPDGGARVAPFTGAWIEIRLWPGRGRLCSESLPSRERGLKSAGRIRSPLGWPVAPFTGRGLKYKVYNLLFRISLSLPSRERGLKYGHLGNGGSNETVAPFTGAWIEMPRSAVLKRP